MSSLVGVRSKVAARRRSLMVSMLLAPMLLAACSGSSNEALAPDDGTDFTATEADVVSATAVSSREADATVLTSPTVMNAKVSVPDGALRPGASGADITAEVVGLDSASDGAGLVAFVLGPDGATFTQPVLLEWDGPWSATGQYTLEVYTGDGEPIAASSDPTVNSLAALRVEPTGDDRAHYTLPVDHFSVWMVVFEEFGSNARYAAYDLDDYQTKIEVGSTGTREVGAWGELGMGCDRGVITEVPSTLEVSFESDLPLCSNSSERHLKMVVTCKAEGTFNYSGIIYSLRVPSTNASTAAWASDPAGLVYHLRIEMLRTAKRMYQLAQGKGTAAITDSPYGFSGRMYSSDFTDDVVCVKPAAVTTTVAAASVTTVEVSTNTSADVARASTTSTATTQPAAVTTAESAVTSTSVAVSTGPIQPPTTIEPIAPTTMATTTTGPWGREGDWAFDQAGSCNWNGSGSCGWYYGSTYGEYIAGPPRYPITVG